MSAPVPLAAGLLPVTPVLGVVIAGLLVAAWVVVVRAGLGHGRDTLVAGVRATVQLLAVSAVLTQAVEHLWVTLLFVVVMYAVAALTAAGRVTRARRDATRTVVPIAAGTVPILVVLLVTGLVPLRGLVLVPVAGILVGGAMTATSLAGRRALEELTTRRGEVEAAMAIGMTVREARLEICRPAASGALVPALDQTRTVGLVTLPGAFVGMLLGGADGMLYKNTPYADETALFWYRRF